MTNRSGQKGLHSSARRGGQGLTNARESAGVGVVPQERVAQPAAWSRVPRAGMSGRPVCKAAPTAAFARADYATGPSGAMLPARHAVMSSTWVRRLIGHEHRHRRPDDTRRAQLRRPRRAAPPRTARALLPPARIVRRRGGPGAGGVPARGAAARPTRGGRRSAPGCTASRPTRAWTRWTSDPGVPRRTGRSRGCSPIRTTCSRSCPIIARGRRTSR
jgi:hypothetical protein